MSIHNLARWNIRTLRQFSPPISHTNSQHSTHSTGEKNRLKIVTTPLPIGISIIFRVASTKFSKIPAGPKTIPKNSESSKMLKHIKHFKIDFLQKTRLFPKCLYLMQLGKDSPLNEDETSTLSIIGGRLGPSSHCSPSNRLKSHSKIQRVC